MTCPIRSPTLTGSTATSPRGSSRPASGRPRACSMTPRTAAAAARRWPTRPGFDEKQLLCWANIADRMRIKGVSKDYAELLQAAGVDTVKELKYRNPGQARPGDGGGQQASASWCGCCRPTSVVARWIDHAKKLPLKITLLSRAAAGSAPLDTACGDRAKPAAMSASPRPSADPRRDRRADCRLPRCWRAAGRWSWAFSTSRRIPFPTAASSSIRRSRIAHARDDDRARRRHPRHRRGIDPALWRRQAGRRRRRTGAADADAAGGRRSSACRSRSTPSRRRVAAWALDQGAAHRQRRLGPAARPRHGAAGRRARRAGHRHAQPRQAPMPAIDIVADVDRLLRPLARHRRRRPASPRDQIVLDPGIGFGKTPEQSIACIAQARRIQALRPAAPGRRLAQALHQLGVAVAAGRAASAARSPRI